MAGPTISGRGAARAYAHTHLARKPQLRDALLGRFVDDCRQARDCMAEGDVAGTAGAIDHAQRIVAALAIALDPRIDAGASRQLAALYDQVGACLARGLETRDPELVARAEAEIAVLRQRFRALWAG